MGGTFMSLPEDYRDYFIRSLHDALSGHTSNSVAEAVRSARGRVTLRGACSITPSTPNLVGGVSDKIGGTSVWVAKIKFNLGANC